MKKAEVMALIPKKFVDYWKTWGEGNFGSHSFTMMHSCGFPLVITKSYQSVKDIESKRLSRYVVRLEIKTFTKKEGWDNLSWRLRRKHCSMTRDNLPYPSDPIKRVIRGIIHGSKE